jgi:hypothetical protein
MSDLASKILDLSVDVPDHVWQKTLDLASEVETLEARLRLVSDLARTARNAAPEGKEPYWVKAILQAIGES